MNEFWSLNEGVFFCLIDDDRTLAFRSAIQRTVSPGDVVVDLGAGTGVLSMFAADAGASRVYAIELDGGNFRTMENTIRKNGYGDKIICLRGDATSILFPEKPDVIICELVATGLVEELQVPAMSNALRQCSSDVKCLIKSYSIWVDGVSNKNSLYGKIFDVVRYEFPDMPETSSKPITDKVTFKHVEFNVPEIDRAIQCEIYLVAQEDGVINGLRLGGTTTFHDGQTYDHSFSYSFPMILPVNEISVVRGQALTACLSYRLCEGPEHLDWSLVATRQ